MAEVVSGQAGKDAFLPKRNYVKYLDGQVWKLTLGVDCPQAVNTARAVVSMEAKRHGMKVRVSYHKSESAIYVQAILGVSK